MATERSTRSGFREHLVNILDALLATAIAAGTLPLLSSLWKYLLHTDPPSYMQGMLPNFIGIIVLLPLVWLITRWSLLPPNEVPQRSHVTHFDRRRRLQVLKAVRLDWIDGVLKRSLYQVARIDFGLQTVSGAVEQPLKAIVQMPDQAPVAVPSGISIGQIFDEHAGALLILGAPGTGKTTLLLELAEQLLNRAQQDEDYPIPMVFNLSSWGIRRQPLDQWLASELNERSDVPRGIARQWVDGEQVIPLLDGLDEVAPQHRRACAEAINDFRKCHGFLPIAVCSRMEDYKNLGTKLRLRSAIVVQMLTKSEVENYLEKAGPSLQTLRVAITRDSLLWELLKTPLMLWIAMLTYQDAPVEFLETDNLKLRRNRLFANFVSAMAERRPATIRYAPSVTLSWLSWLASRLKQNDQVVFHLEDLREEWLSKPWQKLISRVGLVICSGFVAGIVGGLIGSLVDGLDFATSIPGVEPRLVFILRAIAGAIQGGTIGLVTGAAVALIGAFMDLRPIETIKITVFDMSSRLRKAVRHWMIVSTFASLIFGSLGFLNDRVNEGTYTLLRLPDILGAHFTLTVTFLFRFRDGLMTGLGMGIAFGIATLVSGEAVDTRRRPNQGTRRSLRIALITGTSIGLLTGLIMGSFVGVGSGVFNGLINGLVAAMVAGGLFCLNHLVTRVVLFMTRAAPFHYARFLNYAVERAFLYRVGSGYIFVHRMLREYFASLETHPSVNHGRGRDKSASAM